MPDILPPGLPEPTLEEAIAAARNAHAQAQNILAAFVTLHKVFRRAEDAMKLSATLDGLTVRVEEARNALSALKSEHERTRAAQEAEVQGARQQFEADVREKLSQVNSLEAQITQLSTDLPKHKEAIDKEVDTYKTSREETKKDLDRQIEERQRTLRSLARQIESVRQKLGEAVG